MSKIIQTEVRRIYWEEDTANDKNQGIMIFELTNGRRMELIYNTEEPAECMGTGIEVVTSLGFRDAL